MNTRIAVVFLAAALASPALAQSRDPSLGSGNIDRSDMTAPTAPVGHRQPRAGDVPGTNINDSSSAYARDSKLERTLRICRGC
jgi:hypothetical protein